MAEVLVPSTAEAALSPWLQSIERSYVDTGRTYADSSGVNLRLNDAGVWYGTTWEGARNLAVYAAVRYQQATGKTFPRPVAYAWNAVDAEIHDHCMVAVGLNVIPYILGRANPINIGLTDRPPAWGGLQS